MPQLTENPPDKIKTADEYDINFERPGMTHRLVSYEKLYIEIGTLKRITVIDQLQWPDFAPVWFLLPYSGQAFRFPAMLANFGGCGTRGTCPEFSRRTQTVLAVPPKLAALLGHTKGGR